MDIVCVQQPDGSFKSSPFHVRFGKLKLLKAARKSVTIIVNGVESQEVAMLLGHEGEAFFLREAFEDEAKDSIENVSSSMRLAIVDSTSRTQSASNACGAIEDQQKQQKGPKSGHDAAEYKKGNHMLEELELDENIKKGANTSPKSAHHAMGLEAADKDGLLGGYERCP